MEIGQDELLDRSEGIQWIHQDQLAHNQLDTRGRNPSVLLSSTVAVFTCACADRSDRNGECRIDAAFA